MVARALVAFRSLEREDDAPVALSDDAWLGALLEAEFQTAVVNALVKRE